MGGVGTPWPPERVNELVKLRDLGYSRSQIAEILGVSLHAVKGALARTGGMVEHPNSHKAPFRRVEYSESESRARAPAHVYEELERRLKAPYRDQTAAFCGDPPLGFSALDRR